METPDQRAQSGFTLLESLLALLIAAGGLAAIYSTHATSLQARQKADNKSLIMLVGEDILEQVGSTLPIEEGRRTGRRGDVIWTMETMRAEDIVSSSSGLLLIELEVRTPDGSSSKFQTLRFRGEPQ